MKTVLASVALFFAGAFAQNSFTINTPTNVVECQPSLLSWTGGTGDILPGSTPNGAALESFPATNSSSFTWVVNIASGTSIGLTLRDGTGTVVQSAAFTIQGGSSSSCLNSTSIVPGPTAASTPAAQSTGGASTAGASTGSATGTSGATSPSTSSKSGASANVAQFGAAGIVGAVVAALFI